MRSRNIKSWHLLIMWAVVTLPYVLIRFDVRFIPMEAKNAERWNDIGSNFFLTFSTSLAFWLITEWLLKGKKEEESMQAQAEFLNDCIETFNKQISDIKHHNNANNRPTENLLEHAPDEEIWRIYERFFADMVRQFPSRNEFRHREGVNAIIGWLYDEIATHHTNALPYSGSFDMDFTKAMNKMMMEFKHGIQFARERDINKSDIHVVTLTRFRQAFVSLVNEHRTKHGITPMMVNPSPDPVAA